MTSFVDDPFSFLPLTKSIHHFVLFCKTLNFLPNFYFPSLFSVRCCRGGKKVELSLEVKKCCFELSLIRCLLYYTSDFKFFESKLTGKHLNLSCSLIAKSQFFSYFWQSYLLTCFQGARFAHFRIETYWPPALLWGEVLYMEGPYLVNWVYFVTVLPENGRLFKLIEKGAF